MDTHKQEHDAAWPLLPWHAQGQLAPGEEALVDGHLRTCETCRAELAWQRQLHGAARGADQAAPLPDTEAALARLLPRLDGQPAPAARSRPRMPGALAALMAWLRRPLMLPAALALALVALSVPLPFADRPGYEGLGPVPDAGGTTVVFRPGTNAADVRRILDAAGADAVHGPTAVGAYVLDIAPARQANALARLRAEPAVLVAEPLDAGDAP